MIDTMSITNDGGDPDNHSDEYGDYIDDLREDVSDICDDAEQDGGGEE